jgi:hypothetical protein
MEPTFVSAIEHIKVMEARVRQQTEAICLLKAVGRDTTDADRRLKLLNFALAEMRIQLAHLAPTQEEAEAPTWALPFINPALPAVMIQTQRRQEQSAAVISFPGPMPSPDASALQGGGALTPHASPPQTKSGARARCD